jgi:hypothetical protein
LENETLLLFEIRTDICHAFGVAVEVEIWILFETLFYTYGYSELKILFPLLSLEN